MLMKVVSRKKKTYKRRQRCILTSFEFGQLPVNKCRDFGNHKSVAEKMSLHIKLLKCFFFCLIAVMSKSNALVQFIAPESVRFNNSTNMTG